MRTETAMITMIFILAVACKGGEDRKEEGKKIEFYPVNALIRHELDLIDSLPVAVFRYSAAGDRADTQIITKPIFRKAVEMYFSPDISLDPIRKKFTEKVYLDQTINRVNISYETEDPEMEIRKLDVFIDPETEKVRNIYLEKNHKSGDSIISQKMLWTPGRKFQITTFSIADGREGPARNEIYAWDTGN
jgi:hypothetical protein